MVSLPRDIPRFLFVCSCLLTRQQIVSAFSFVAPAAPPSSLRINQHQYGISIARAHKPMHKKALSCRSSVIGRSSALSMSSSASSSLFAKSQGKKRLAMGMAFLTGWADVALFFKYKSFATMMTGNTMWMALATIESRNKDAFYYASLIVSYILGVAAFRKVDLEDRSIRFCGLAVMVLFVLSDIIQHVTSTRWIPMILLATAFGLTNSVGQEASGTLTFVVTGSMTKLANQFVDRVSRKAGRKKLTTADKQAVVLNISVIGSFFSGALWAFFLHSQQLLNRFGVFSILGFMYGALFLWQDTRYLGGVWWVRNDANMHVVDDDRTESEIEEDLKRDPLEVSNLPL